MTQVQDPKAYSNFKGWCSDLKDYVLDLVTRFSGKFARTMKELEQYLGETYRNTCWPAIFTKTPMAFPET